MIRAVGSFIYMFPNRLRRVWQMVSDPKLSRTYYPEEERKSKIRIFLENLWCLLRYQEVNNYYYCFGLDRKTGINPRDYFTMLQYKKWRTRANAYYAQRARRHMPKWIEYGCLLDDKFLFSQYLTSLGFPVPKIIAVGNCDTISWLDGEGKKPFTSLAERDLDVFIKEFLADSAQGIYPVKVSNGKLFIKGQEYSLEQLRERIMGRILLQERIHQHPRLNELNPGSVNCIRLITVCKNDAISPFYAVLKTGVRGSPCDNWCAGGLAIKMDLLTGRLDEYGFFSPGKGTRTDRHPDTGMVFKGFQAPYYQEAIKLAVALHEYFYAFHSIGWDIAFTENGPVFIEGNYEWSLSIYQATHGSGRKAYLQTLPDELVAEVSK